MNCSINLSLQATESSILHISCEGRTRLIPLEKSADITQVDAFDLPEGKSYEIKIEVLEGQVQLKDITFAGET